jgi:hypothetical protein
MIDTVLFSWNAELFGSGYKSGTEVSLRIRIHNTTNKYNNQTDITGL